LSLDTELVVIKDCHIKLLNKEGSKEQKDLLKNIGINLLGSTEINLNDTSTTLVLCEVAGIDIRQLANLPQLN